MVFELNKLVFAVESEQPQLGGCLEDLLVG